MTNPNPKTLTLNPFPFRELTVRLDRARAYLRVPFTHHLLAPLFTVVARPGIGAH